MDDPLPRKPIDPEQLVVVLVEPHHPGNIGSVARAMNNMGVTSLRLVRPCSINGESRYMAWNSLDILEGAEIHDSLPAALADCVEVYGFSARGGRQRTGPRDLSCAAAEIGPCEGKVALVFGREDAGLRIEEYELCHVLVRIPTSDRHRSLNLAQAVMVALYEFVGRGRAGIPTAPRVATSRPSMIDVELFEKLLVDWEQALRTLGYHEFGPADLMRRVMKRWRRILVRARLDRDDADLLFGLARRIQGRYRVPGSRKDRRQTESDR